MNINLRKPIIAGNWKMNLNRKEAATLITDFAPNVLYARSEVVIAVPFTNLETAKNIIKTTNIKLAAQNCHFEKKGAYTGEISVPMLKDLGTDYVIIGHSERRQYFAETNQTVNLKIKAALEHNLKVILCVGETLEQREQNITTEVISLQVIEGLKNIKAKDMQNIVIAYEPIWAIGTGETATAQQAEDVCKSIRKILTNIFSDEISQKTAILYGGSMNAQNAKDLLSEENIDGGLIGGASLKAREFTEIIKIADELVK